MVDGKVHHFGACGLSNGLAVLGDEETRSYWDHISGEAFLGPLKGHKLESWPIQMTTVAAVLQEHPEARLLRSPHRSFGMWFMKLTNRQRLDGEGFIPPFVFASTMSKEIDARLPKLEQGLGVLVGKKAHFFPMQWIPEEGIHFDWKGRVLVVKKGDVDGIPAAKWADTEEKPMQLLSRWYGFSFTYPHSGVWEKKEDA